MSMEGNSFSQESNLNNQVEGEKSNLETNSVEVADLIEEKDGNFSEKAKLLMARIGKIGTVGLGVAGGALLLNGAGLDVAAAVDAIGHHWDEISTAGSAYRSVALDFMGTATTIAGIGGICAALGVEATRKLRGVIDRLKVKHSTTGA